MKGPLEARLPRFLLKYRVTPQATTGIAPTELLMGCRIRTYLDLLYPTTRQRVRDHLIQQKKSGDMKAHTRQFNQGDRIMGQNFADGPKWLPGKVLEGGKTIVKVKLDDGRIWHHHANHFLPSQVQIESESIDQECAPPMSLEIDPLVASSSEQNAESTPTENQDPRVVPGPHVPVGPPRRSTRVSRPPDKLM